MCRSCFPVSTQDVAFGIHDGLNAHPCCAWLATKPSIDCVSATQVGMHFMNPVPVMPLVEIVRGIATSDAVRPNPSLTNPAP